MDYISYIRSKVGHDKVILTFAGGILADDEGRVLLQLRGDKKTWAIPGGAMGLGESTRFLNVYSNFEEVYPNGDAVQTVVFIYELAAVSSVNIADFHNEETLRLRFFSKEEIENLESVSSKHRLILAEYFDDNFAMGH